MRIIHFSDFHLDYEQITRCENLIDRMIHALQQVHQEKAIDVIVFSGDLWAAECRHHPKQFQLCFV